jgi:hypothetical protein
MLKMLSAAKVLSITVTTAYRAFYGGEQFLLKIYGSKP